MQREDDRQIEHWRERVNDPRQWVAKAVQVLGAVECVSSKHHERDENDIRTTRAVGLVEPLMMLRGMAFECLAKALAAKNGHRFDQLDWLVTDHNLVKLSKRVSLAIDKDETEMLERLTNACQSFGRFPVARNAFKGYRKYQGQWVTNRSWGSEDDILYDTLIRQLFEVIDVERDAIGNVIFRPIRS